MLKKRYIIFLVLFAVILLIIAISIPEMAPEASVSNIVGFP